MLGIIDWGIGGVSIYKLLKVRKPDISILYFPTRVRRLTEGWSGGNWQIAWIA